MEKARRNANLMLLIASAIWGFAFVAQRVGMRYVEPFTFNGIRFALGALVLLPIVAVLRRRSAAPGEPPAPIAWGRVLRGGLVAGFFIFAGSTLQQFGLVYTTAGKAGFITGLYVVFVPLIGLFLGHRATPAIWGGAALAAAGLYLLSAKGMTSIELGDGLVLLSALFWAGHVLLIGRLVRTIDPVQLAVAQFTVVSLASLAGAAVFESPALGPVLEAAVPILYAGLMSVGVAYTLQVVAQRHAKPAHAAIILSMESVFAAVGGWLLLDEHLPLRGLIGCALMLGGVLLVQIEGEPQD
jgi:drug/metabolite transporter (DMT)-like permease